MTTTLQPGTLVAGKYRIERIIGRGGMGLVMEATHVGLEARYALKFLAEEIAADPTALARFRREAQASAALRSEHICRVSDVGLEGKTPFIVMELLVGTDLARLSKLRTLDVATAALYVHQACIGLAEAHAAKIIHRDLKPGNLFLTRRPDGTALIKILDFGVAKAPDDANQKLTGTANVVGSPGFMSPEQFRSSKNVDGRCDVWSLGVILYKLVSGRLPFKADGFAEFALAISRDPVPPLPEVAPGFEAIVKRCLEKDVSKRFATVEQLAEALAPFAAAARSSAPQIYLESSPPLDEVSSGYGGQDGPGTGEATRLLGSDSHAPPMGNASPPAPGEFRKAPVAAQRVPAPAAGHMTAPAGPGAIGRSTPASGNIALAATPPAGTPVLPRSTGQQAAKQTILGVASDAAPAAPRVSAQSPVMRPTMAETAIPHAAHGTLTGTAVDGGTRRYVPIADLTPGMVVGEYRIDQKIGEGGMGVVYSATHPLIGKRAAIKVIGAELGTDAVVVERFVQEARSVNQIGHPNIVDVFAFGKLPDGRNYFIMEYLQGESLRARLFRAFMTIPEAIQILDEVASALEAAHEKAIVHRDLKPDNVYLANVRGGKLMVKLLDFGIAKLTSETGMAKTSTGEMIGTPAYLSPEQARGRNVDNRTDIYALGCMMYEMITGRLPFIAESPMDIVMMHISATPRRPSELKPDIPPLLEQTILQMLAKDPQTRPNLVHLRNVFAELVASGAVQLEAGTGSTFRSDLASGARTPRSSPRNEVLGQSSSRNPVATGGPPPRASVNSEQMTAINFNPGAATLVPADQRATTMRPAAAPPRKGRTLLVVLLLFVVAAGGGAAAFFVLTEHQGAAPGAKQSDAAVAAVATATADAAAIADAKPPAADTAVAVSPPAPTVRSVIVRSSVPTAAIEVDDVTLDSKRGIAQVDLTDGSHHVVVSAAGYVTYDELVDVEAAHTAVQVTLVRGKATSTTTNKHGSQKSHTTQTQPTQTQTQAHTTATQGTQGTQGTGSSNAAVKKDETINPF